VLPTEDNRFLVSYYNVLMATFVLSFTDYSEDFYQSFISDALISVADGLQRTIWTPARGPINNDYLQSVELFCLWRLC